MLGTECVCNKYMLNEWLNMGWWRGDSQPDVFRRQTSVLWDNTVYGEEHWYGRKSRLDFES